MILLSLQPSPASETSAFNRIRAFSSRCAGLFPFRIKLSNCSRSSTLSRTTYLFTNFSRAAIVPSVACTATEANHYILSNWLKRATSSKMLGPDVPRTLVRADDRTTVDFAALRQVAIGTLSPFVARHRVGRY